MAVWSYMRANYTLDIKFGYACNNSCQHCVVDPVRNELERQKQEKDLSTEQIKDIIDDAITFGFKKIVFTGGEVTIRNDFKELVLYASNRGLGINIQTNGRMLSESGSYEFMENIPDLLLIVALHSCHAHIHDTITQVKGSFEETIKAICNIKRIGKEVTIKTVISMFNYNCLCDTVLYAKELGVNELCIAFPHAPGFRTDKYTTIVPSYTSIKDEIARTVNASEREDILVTFETIPYCIYPETEAFWYRNCDLLSISSQDSHAQTTQLKPYDGLYWEELRPTMKHKKDTCVMCMLNQVCEGPWKEYVEHFGDIEFTPIGEDQIGSLISYEKVDSFL